MRYHLFKQSRNYAGRPYKGMTWQDAREPAETDDLEIARAMKTLMTDWNPVGWDIFDSKTGELVK